MNAGEFPRCHFSTDLDNVLIIYPGIFIVINDMYVS
jgi:hypothetical protein